jgi:branched-chain amino acid aminotransferase
MAYPIIDVLSGLYIVDNGNFVSVDSPTVSLLQTPVDEIMFYEVIRISRQIPLFWEDHIDRMKKSISGRFDIPTALRADCLKLIKTHLEAGYELDQSNLRIVLTPDKYIIHLIPSYYPSVDQFESGVPVLILDWERKDPNVKLIRSDYKEAVNRGFARTGPFGKPFELLLADRNHYLTEGSRSNLFFIAGKSVFSAPDNLILKGITRKYVIEAVENAGADLKIKLISNSDLESGLLEAAFLSGSPIDLLPISAIEHHKLQSSSNELFQRINLEYHKILSGYIEKNKPIL